MHLINVTFMKKIVLYFHHTLHEQPSTNASVLVTYKGKWAYKNVTVQFHLCSKNWIQYNILDMEFWWDDANECKMKCKKEYKIFICVYGISIINIGNLPFCVFKIFEIVNWVIKQNLDYAMRTLLLRSKHITVRGYRRPNIKHHYFIGLYSGFLHMHCRWSEIIHFAWVHINRTFS